MAPAKAPPDGVEVEARDVYFTATEAIANRTRDPLEFAHEISGAAIIRDDMLDIIKSDPSLPQRLPISVVVLRWLSKRAANRG